MENKKPKEVGIGLVDIDANEEDKNIFCTPKIDVKEWFLLNYYKELEDFKNRHKFALSYLYPKSDTFVQQEQLNQHIENKD